MLTARQVADYFLARADEAGEPLSLGELQTLCFYAQGFHLGVWAEPLFGDDVLASEDGPVIRRLEEACAQRSVHVSASDCMPPDPNGRAVRKILDATYDERRSIASSERRMRSANSQRRGETIPHEEIRAGYLAWARDWVGPPEPPVRSDAVRRILADHDLQEGARRGEADLAAGRVRPLE